MDFFTGHISVWPFYQAHFNLTFFPGIFQFDLSLGTFQFDVFTRHAYFNLTFLAGTFQFDLFSGHISVWPFYWAHFNLKFLQDTLQFNLRTGHFSIWPFYWAHFSVTFLADTFQFDLCTGHFSIWPLYRAYFNRAAERIRTARAKIISGAPMTNTNAFLRLRLTLHANGNTKYVHVQRSFSYFLLPYRAFRSVAEGLNSKKVGGNVDLPFKRICLKFF